MRKLAIALASIGISTSLYAGQPGNQVMMPTGINIVAPDTVGIWSFGAEIYHVKATNDDFQYGQVLSLSPAGDLITHNVSPYNAFHAGGAVDATYLIPDNAGDIKIGMTHLQMIDTNTVTVAGLASGEILQPSFPGTIILAGANSQARVKDEQHFTAADLVFGQWFRIGHEVDLHPFGGLRYTDITDRARVTYTDAATTVTQLGQINSDFDGVGPRLGIDAAVHVGWGFSFVGTLAGGLQIGDIDSSAKSADPGSPIAFKYDNDDNTYVIPELDMRIGVDYIYNFTPTASMSAQIGAQNVAYFGVMQKDIIDINTPNSNLGSSDFGYRGFYFRMQVNLA